MTTKLTLKKFGAAWCGPCRELARRGTLEKFAAAHPDVKVEVHDDTLNGSARYEKLADEWGIKSIPVVIWCLGDKELLRSQDVTLVSLEKQYEKALRLTS